MEGRTSLVILAGLVIFVNVVASRVLISVPMETPVPNFPEKYFASGIIRLHYADINEPFTSWYDGPNNRSRIDYYDGTMKTYQRADVNAGGVKRNVIPFTQDSIHIETACFEVNGTANATVSIQGVIPDLQRFKFIGQKTLDGKNYNVWENITSVNNKVNTYRFWASTENDITIPKKYEMFGYDSLFGSHYDKYELIYNNFTEVEFANDTFDIDSNLKCRSFPGPGKQHAIQMNPMQEFVDSNDAHVHGMFEEFKSIHNKKYKDNIEHSKRKMNFHQNLRFIHSHNRAGKSYQLGINHMADRNKDEMSRLRGRINSNPDERDGLDFDASQYDLSDLPDSLDWRYYGAVTPVKDQAICGSCWSFGTTGTIEGAYFIKTQQLTVLSQQALIDCSWAEGNNGCDGGEDYRAYRWIKEKGLPKASAYGPYLGIDGRCHHQNISKSDLVYIKNYVNVTSRNADHMKLALFNNGPVSVSIDASQKTFSFYANGVYDDSNCKHGEDELDHSVLAVGYGVIYGRPYWLIKNSWSTYWGNDGYVLMSQSNDCGVTTSATYVIM